MKRQGKKVHAGLFMIQWKGILAKHNIAPTSGQARRKEVQLGRLSCVAREFHVAFASHGCSRVLALNFDRAFPVGVAC
jgi:hypothetical protein